MRTRTRKVAQAITWTALYTCWANLQSFPRGRQLVRPYFALQLYPMATKLISIRWMKDFEIDASMRIQYIKSDKTHIYQILGVDNIEEANVELLCIAPNGRQEGVVNMTETKGYHERVTATRKQN